MRRLLPFCGTLLLTVHSLPAQERPVQVVPSVDLTRYTGTWYEIARYPNRFQDFCVGDVTATYTLLEEGEIEVINRCRSAAGEMKDFLSFLPAFCLGRLLDHRSRFRLQLCRDRWAGP